MKGKVNIHPSNVLASRNNKMKMKMRDKTFTYLFIFSKVIPLLKPLGQSFHTRQNRIIRPEIPHRTNIIRENTFFKPFIKFVKLVNACYNVDQESVKIRKPFSKFDGTGSFEGDNDRV